ncbi:MAG: hypothetical protein QOK49_1374 [Baekduia sp.]|nr:hypothetical protein [Baekduia sp.]
MDLAVRLATRRLRARRPYPALRSCRDCVEPRCPNAVRPRERQRPTAITIDAVSPQRPLGSARAPLRRTHRDQGDSGPATGQQTPTRPHHIFTDLLKGPKERGTKRQIRVFHDGRTTDIYGALLHAIAHAGKMEVSHIESSEDPGARPRRAAAASADQPFARLHVDHRQDSARHGRPRCRVQRTRAQHPGSVPLFYLRYGTYSLTKDMSTPDPDQIELPGHRGGEGRPRVCG